MKIFFDCEFTGLHQHTTLISIGCVTENSDIFYAEFDDYNESQVDEWIQENVIKHLHFSPPKADEDKHWIWEKNGRNVQLRANRLEVARYFADWIQYLHDGCVSWVDYGDTPVPIMIDRPVVEMWGDCLAYDWVLLCDLFDGALNLPKTIHYIPFDICTLFKVCGIDPDISREEFTGLRLARKHNSLYDATVIKACYERLVKIKNVR